MSLERVYGEDDIRVLVVDERTLHPGRQFGRLITELLPRLIELLGNRGRRVLVAHRDHHHPDTRAREGLYPIVPTQLLHSLLERLGDEVLLLLVRASGLNGVDRQ